jgi:hypothetical protein
VIIRDLERGLISSDIGVAIQADVKGGDHMRRVSLRLSRSRLDRGEQRLSGGSSADEAEFQKFLDWLRQSWNAENYAITVLGPDGPLTEMCLDESSGKWLDSSAAGRISAAANDALGNRVRLFFLRQSGRASLENLFSFAGAADYILASPLTVAFPGTYYVELLRTVSIRPDLNGLDVASAVMEGDRDYALYTLVSDQELKTLPDRLSPAVDALLKSPRNPAPASMAQTFAFSDETDYDALSFFEALTPEDDPEISEKVSDFLGWYRSRLILRKSRGPLGESGGTRWSGLSVVVPKDPEQAGRAKSLPLYQRTNLGGLMSALSQGSGRQ